MAQAQISRSGGSQRSNHGQMPAGYSTGGYPVGYPGVPVRQGSMNSNFAQPVTMGARSQSRNSLAKQSRSLGASKASLASQGGKTSIQREFHDKRVRQNMKASSFGKGRTPFIISIVFFIIAGLLILSGIVVLLLRFHNNIMLSVDKGEIIGPLLIAIGIASIAGGVKFYYDSYIISEHERRNIRFTPASDSLISTKSAKPTSSSSYKPPPHESLVSGSVTANAVSRTPHGSMGSLDRF